MNLKEGNRVKLTKNAIKRFYGRAERFEDFEVAGKMNGQQFCQFVNDFPFSTGKVNGKVTDVLSKVLEVVWEGPLGPDFGYFDIKDLTKVR